MPKGVEHTQRAVNELAAFNSVIHPLMPKGVEHRWLAKQRGGQAVVIHPLMPKGVEHGWLQGPVLSQVGDSSVDAERR